MIKQFLDFWWLAAYGALLPIHTQSSNAWSAVCARAACRSHDSQSERFFWPMVFVAVPSDCKKISRQFRETGHNHFLLLLSNSSLTNSEITSLIWAVQKESLNESRISLKQCCCPTSLFSYVKSLWIVPSPRCRAECLRLFENTLELCLHFDRLETRT